MASAGTVSRRPLQKNRKCRAYGAYDFFATLPSAVRRWAKVWHASGVEKGKRTAPQYRPERKERASEGRPYTAKGRSGARLPQAGGGPTKAKCRASRAKTAGTRKRRGKARRYVRTRSSLFRRTSRFRWSCNQGKIPRRCAPRNDRNGIAAGKGTMYRAATEEMAT